MKSNGHAPLQNTVIRNASGGTRTLNAIKTSASEADTSANSVTLAKVGEMKDSNSQVEDLPSISI